MKQALVFVLIGLSTVVHAEVTSIPLTSDVVYTDGYRYEAVIYGSQAPGRWVIGSHLFGQFVKRTSDGQIVETVDMSLMPTRLRDIPLRERRPLQLLRGIVPGKNLTVNETLELTQSEGKIVGSVGPIPVSHQVFDEAKRRVEGVRSGEIKYRFIDTFSRFNGNMNCRTFLAGNGFRGLLTGPQGAAAIADTLRIQPTPSTVCITCAGLALDGNTVFVGQPAYRR